MLLGRLIVALFTLVGMVVVGLLAIAVGLFVYDEYRRKLDADEEPGEPVAGPPTEPESESV